MMLLCRTSFSVWPGGDTVGDNLGLSAADHLAFIDMGNVSSVYGRIAHAGASKTYCGFICERPFGTLDCHPSPQLGYLTSEAVVGLLYT